MTKARPTLIARVGLWLPLFVLVAIWQCAAGRADSVAFFFSTPVKVASTAWDMLGADYSLAIDVFTGTPLPPLPYDGILWNSAITAFEAISGFVVGNSFGALLGIALAQSTTIARISRPYLIALGALPVFALAPITILWFGIGVGAKVALATLATVFLAAAQAFKGAEEVDPLLLQRFRVLGARHGVIFRNLLLPSALVWIVASLRLTISAALLGAFIGEFISSEQGIGRVIIRASGLYDTPRVLVGVIVMILLALVLDAVVGRLERRLFRWRRET
jgi:NitT/TauT family transport system permease protein